jgi:hypothetical protein
MALEIIRKSRGAMRAINIWGRLSAVSLPYHNIQRATLILARKVKIFKQ